MRSQKTNITITLEGGLIQHIDYPPDVRIIVKDFDAHEFGFDAEDVKNGEVKFNQDGNAYWLHVWKIDTN